MALAAKFEDAAADAEKKSKAKFADMEQKHCKEKSAADDACKKQLANLRGELEGSMGEQANELQMELDALRKKAAADLDSLRAVHQQEVESIEAASDGLLNDAEAERQQLQKVRGVCGVRACGVRACGVRRDACDVLRVTCGVVFALPVSRSAVE